MGIDRGAPPFPPVALVVAEGVLGVPPVEAKTLTTQNHSTVEGRVTYWHIYSLNKMLRYLRAKYRCM